eukprot:m.145072 g.145072  ORF g.145072 m.145072 type:complete len:939 (+) comp16778_c0_seq16:20-2836(+)
MEGYLLHERRKLLGRKQSRKFFVLAEGGSSGEGGGRSLQWFRDASRAERKGAVQLGAACTATVLPGLALLVQPTGPGSRDALTLVAESEEQRAAWLAVFAKNNAATSPAAVAAPPPSAAVAPPVEGKAATKTKAPSAVKRIASKKGFFDGLGISVAFIRKFSAEHLVGDRADFTTAQICEAVVKERTRALECSYVQYLQQAADSGSSSGVDIDVGKAKVFVSHAWKYKLRDVFTVMLEYADKYAAENPKAPPLFFYFDLFCNNQHATESHPFDWWCSTFQRNIMSIGQVLLVMAPWDDPVPLTRAWCLWEIHCALDGKVPLTIGLPPDQRGALLQGVSESFSVITNALVRIDAERSEAFKQEDRDNIHRAVQESELGFDGLNDRVKGRLRDWYLTTALELAEAKAQEETEEAARVLSNLAWSLNEFNEMSHASRFLERVHAIFLKLFGEIHLETANSLKAMGHMAGNRGDNAACLEILERALQILTSLTPEQLGGYDERSQRELVADTRKAVAAAHRALGHPSKALAILLELEPYVHAIDGENTQLMANTLVDTAAVYNDVCDFTKALQMADRALKINISLLGENHPITANTIESMAVTYRLMGDFPNSLQATQRVLRINLAVYGLNHTATATSYANMGMAYDNLAEHAKAREAYQRSFEVFLHVYGEMHTICAASLMNVGLAFHRTGKLREALNTYERAAVIYKQVLPENHPDIGQVSGNYALLHYDMGDLDKAQVRIQKSFAILLKEYEPTNIVVAYSRNWEGLICTGRKKYADGHKAFQTCIEIFQKNECGGHPDMARAMCDWAALCIEDGKLDRADDLLRQASSILNAANSEAKRALPLHHQGVLALKRGKPSEALSFFEQALALRHRFLGRDHPFCAFTERGIGEAYAALNKLTEAREHLDTAQTTALLELDAKHPEVAKINAAIAALKSKPL